MLEPLYDVVIIGGGPAGLSAAQYAARAKLKTVVIDKSSTAGSLAYASLIENYPGLENPMTGKELLEFFRKQALVFGAEYVESQVIGCSLQGEIKEVLTMDRTFQAKTVIVATGSMGRKATIKGEADFLGRGVSYCAICDAAFFKGKTVCVIGDSEEAVKEAGVLTRFAETTYLIAPSQKLKVRDDHPVLKMDTLRIILGHTVTSLPGVFAAGDVTCTEVRQVIVAAANGCVAALSAEKYIFQRKRRRYDWHG